MKRIVSHLVAVTGLTLALCGTAAAQQLKPLFTKPGKVTEGWTTRHWVDVSEQPKSDAKWEVKEDGILWGTGQFNKDGDKNWVGTWLLSEKEYGDFILEAEFRFRNGGKLGNGGIALRAPLKGDPAYEGMELQITDESFEFNYFPLASSAQLTGALYLVSRPTKLMYKAGEWNKYRVEMRGPKVKVTLNGELIQDVDLDKLTKPALKHGEGQNLVETTSGAKRPRRGHIGFQDLSESGETLQFRNVKIAELN
jgi:hypothetical protein